MRRRAFLTGALAFLAAPPAEAQAPGNVPRVGVLTVNLKTAKALGLTIPPSLLLRADEVIQQ